MKYLFVVILAIMISVSLAIAEPQEAEKDVEDVDKGVARCPFNQMTDQETCLGCHRVAKVDGKYKWAVQEDKWRDTPYSLEIVQRDGEDVGFFEMHSGVRSSNLASAYEYLHKHGINRLIIDIDSPGGSLTEGWRCVGLINQFPEIITRTQCFGYAASAASLVLAAGQERVANPRAMIMLHQLKTMKWLSVESPAESKDESEIMAIWQDNIDYWLASVTNMTVEMIREKTTYKDWWFTGAEGLKLGIVDALTFPDTVVAE